MENNCFKSIILMILLTLIASTPLLHAEEGMPKESPLLAESPGIDTAYALQVASETAVWDLALHYSEPEADDEILVSREMDTPKSGSVPVRWHFFTAQLRGRMGDLELHAQGERLWARPEDGLAFDADLMFDSPEQDRSQYLIGLDLSIGREIYLLFDYLRRDEDRIAPADIPFDKRMAELIGNGQTLGKNSFMVGARYSLTEISSIELYNIINADNPLMMLHPWLIWSPTHDLNVSLSAQIPIEPLENELDQSVPTAYGRIQLNF